MDRDTIVNRLMELSANGDSAASNVLDMVDGNEHEARTADGETLWAYYLAGLEN